MSTTFRSNQGHSCWAIQSLNFRDLCQVLVVRVCGVRRLVNKLTHRSRRSRFDVETKRLLSPDRKALVALKQL